MPDNIAPFKTVEFSAEWQFKEKGSVFLGQVFPAESELRTEEILKDIRKKHYDATHNCFAWKLRDDKFKYSDDGEPSGTAGIRILNAIEHFEIKDALCVVTRWFGGTKLGVGPLGKAYYSSAEGVITKSGIIIKKPFLEMSIEAPYDFTNRLYHLVELWDVKIKSTGYSEVPVYEILCPYGNSGKFIGELTENPQNEVKVKISEKVIFL